MDIHEWFENLSKTEQDSILHRAYYLDPTRTKTISYTDELLSQLDPVCSHETIIIEPEHAQYNAKYESYTGFIECYNVEPLYKHHLNTFTENIKENFEIDFAVLVSCKTLIRGSCLSLQIATLNNKRVPIFFIGKLFDYPLLMKSVLMLAEIYCEQIRASDNDHIGNHTTVIINLIKGLEAQHKTMIETITKEHNIINDLMIYTKPKDISSVIGSSLVKNADDGLKTFINIIETAAIEIVKNGKDWSIDNIINVSLAIAQSSNVLLTEANCKTILQRKLGGLRKFKKYMIQKGLIEEQDQEQEQTSD